MINRFICVWDPINCKPVHVGDEDTANLHQLKRKNPYLQVYMWVKTSGPWAPSWALLISPGRGSDFWQRIVREDQVPKEVQLLKEMV